MKNENGWPMELGCKARDRITGFEGVVTGRAEYISGCVQVLLAPAVDEKGALRESQWIDAQRIERVGSERILLENGARPGPDRPAPKR